ncbi:unnamed protein product [Didymodactylos carnosus]|uniref:Uncharacterized protein n=1 Tax=Didymodactylos carnosus TaxID=1234261 RepID=A0A8S2G8S8_9BILA|nr:unnamed protein product [Didymodactylos carnosus]CAF4494348.1 unnamed protein product [Didymodactylos carnosus]
MLEGRRLDSNSETLFRGPFSSFITHFITSYCRYSGRIVLFDSETDTFVELTNRNDPSVRDVNEQQQDSIIKRIQNDVNLPAFYCTKTTCVAFGIFPVLRKIIKLECENNPKSHLIKLLVKFICD